MASNVNFDNYGMALGRISHIKKFDNRDGSCKYMITVAAKNSYADQDGKVGSQFIPLEAFVPANRREGILPYLEVGDYVRMNYIVLNDNYIQENGQMHYGIVLRIQGITMLESKAAKAARKTAQAGTQTAPQETPQAAGNTQDPQADMAAEGTYAGLTPEEEAMFASGYMDLGGGAFADELPWN